MNVTAVSHYDSSTTGSFTNHEFSITDYSNYTYDCWKIVTSPGWLIVVDIEVYSLQECTTTCSCDQLNVSTSILHQHMTIASV